MPDLVFRFHGLKIVTRNCPLLVTNPHSASEHDEKRYGGKGASLALTCDAHYEAAAGDNQGVFLSVNPKTDFRPKKTDFAFLSANPNPDF